MIEGLVWCRMHETVHATEATFHFILWPRHDTVGRLRRPGYAAVGRYVHTDCDPKDWEPLEKKPQEK